MIIQPCINVDGMKVKIQKESNAAPKLLKGSLGVVSHTMNITGVNTLVENTSQFSYAIMTKVIFYKMGKSGKFRLTEKTVYLPIVSMGTAGRKSGVEVDSGIKVSEVDVMKCSEDVFLAWLAGQIRKFNHLVMRVSGDSAIAAPAMLSLSKSDRLFQDDVMDMFAHLIGGQSTIAKKDFSCFEELCNNANREKYIGWARLLHSHTAIPEVHYQYHKTRELRTILNRLESSLATMLKKKGCSDKVLIQRNVPKIPGVEPYGEVFNALLPTIKYLSDKSEQLYRFVIKDKNRVYKRR